MNKTSFTELEHDLFKRNGKYAVMGTSFALVHLFYLIFFIRINYLPMAFYNVVSVVGYMFFGMSCAQGVRFKQLYFFCLLEVPLHSVLCTLLLGWDYKFMLFMFGMIPISFYIALFIEDFKHSILIPAISSIFLTILYFVVRVAGENVPPIMHKTVISKYEYYFTYLNTFFAFFMILSFSLLFSFEFSYIQKKYTTENIALDTYASYDTLTGLLNRRSIDSHLDQLYKEHYHDEEGFSVIMCDIDHFKSVNDTYGHDAGDYILKEVASVVSSEVRDNDIVGRWGGEEFLIILNKDKQTATKLAERIRAQIETHEFNYKTTSLHITLTLGVSSFHNGADIGSLIRSADKKLYRGKENGRNQVVS